MSLTIRKFSEIDWTYKPNDFLSLRRGPVLGPEGQIVVHEDDWYIHYGLAPDYLDPKNPAYPFEVFPLPRSLSLEIAKACENSRNELIDGLKKLFTIKDCTCPDVEE